MRVSHAQSLISYFFQFKSNIKIKIKNLVSHIIYIILELKNK